ncbi:hypothetical protein DRQ33_06480 [bacterium]|nr:MAG: hypothetical protein DRQ33_06480 [bacterium]
MQVPVNTIRIDSEPKARKMERDWVYNVFAQCKEANVPFFFKQWGETEPDKDRKLLDEEVYHRYPKQINHLRQSRSVGIL